MTITANFKRTANVAKVQVGEGTPSYYTTVAAAITAANGKTSPTVTILKNATTTEQTITAAMTIDLNGKTVSSTQTATKGVFSIDASGKTVTILDSGTGGKIDHTAAFAGDIYGIKITAGSLDIQGGTIYVENTLTPASSNRAFGIYTKVSTTSITISDGSIEGRSPTYSAYGICTYGTLDMTGGTVKASGEGTLRAIFVRGTSSATATASLANVTVQADATGSASMAVYSYGYSQITVHSGTYTATGTTDVYAAYGRVATGSRITIEGGKFSGTSQDVKGNNTIVSICGGYYP